jgi:hypothetical protein
MFLEKPWVLLLAVPGVVLLLRFSEARRKSLLLSRSLLILLLLFALSSPYTLRETLVEGEPKLLYLTDATRSMELFEAFTGNESTRITGNITPLGDAVLRLLERKGNLVLYTDGNNNAGRNLVDVASLAARLGAALYAVKPELEKDEVWVEIRGPLRAVAGSEITHEIILRKLGGEARYILEVYVDEDLVLGREITQEKPEITIPLSTSFPTLGGHRIKAVITPVSNDTFPENNVYYKSVSVLPKPRILFLSDKPSKLAEALEKNYEVGFKRVGNYSNYDAVIVNDVPLYALEAEVNALAEYVRNGGGLVVIGGENSYDKGGYKGSLFEVYLPVKSVKTEPEGKDLALVLAIDISGSTGALFGEYTKADVEKAIAIGIIRDLKKEHYLGVIAFNVNAYVVADISNAHDRRELEERIASLRFGGGTTILNAQLKAEEMLAPFPGSKYLILLSDGITSLPNSALEMAKTMAGRGIKTYTVGVGYDANDGFLGSLAAMGQGIYFKEGEEGRIKLLFGEEEEEAEVYPLRVLDANHFITSGLSLRGSITGFNEVLAKESARVLVTTSRGEPLLTVWRFGLGKVASLTTDDGSKWAPELYRGENSKLLAATINWVLRDASRGMVRVSDVALGQPIVASTSVLLNATLNGEPLVFDALGEGRYRSVYYPLAPGFYDLRGDGVREVVAVNYPLELLNLGFNPELEAIVKATGGRVLSMDELQSVEEDAKKKTRKRVLEKEDRSLPFILAAMMLFFAEVAARRIREIRKPQIP